METHDEETFFVIFFFLYWNYMYYLYAHIIIVFYDQNNVEVKINENRYTSDRM